MKLEQKIHEEIHVVEAIVMITIKMIIDGIQTRIIIIIPIQI